MAHLDPLSLDGLDDEVRAELGRTESFQGFISQMRQVLALRPKILRALNDLTLAVMAEGSVDLGLKSLVALVSSVAAGCRHCQAHTAFRSSALGVSDEKLLAVWDHERSELFTPAERAALRLARAASVVPNEAGPEHFVELRRHFDDGQIVELVSVVALFGWNNRWNDTMATATEEGPMTFAAERLGDRWEPGKHAR